MRIVAEIAVDRPPNDIVANFVRPLDAHLRDAKLGKVLSHGANELFVEVQLSVQKVAGFEQVLQFLGEAEAPVGTIVYQRGWFGRKLNIHVFGP